MPTKAKETETDPLFDEGPTEASSASIAKDVTISRVNAGDGFTHEGTGAIVSAGDVLVATPDNEHVLTIPAQLADSFTRTKNGKIGIAPGVQEHTSQEDVEIRTPNGTVSVDAGQSYLRSADGYVVVISEHFASGTR